MKLEHVSKNNIHDLTADLSLDSSTAVVGLSGSGKTTFCSLLYREYARRMVSLLSKADREFLFPELTKTDYGALGVSSVPPVKFFHKDTIFHSPRSTIGTRTGLYRSLRQKFAAYYNRSSQYFSFNCEVEGSADLICPKCKGRGTFNGFECTSCKGTRYTDKIHKFTIPCKGKKYDLVQLSELPLSALTTLAADLGMTADDVSLLKFCEGFDIGYLSLSRTMGTLSGGELTRLLLAESLSTSDGNLIIVDELSQGLDDNSVGHALQEMNKIGARNLIWMIDHSRQVIDAATKKLIFGPGSGKNGGTIVKKEVLPSAIDIPREKVANARWVEFKNLKCRNIDVPSLKVPVRSRIAITGRSGCGKSTLVRECLMPSMKTVLPDSEVLLVEQGKAQRVTRRSTVSTFLGVGDMLGVKFSSDKHPCPYCGGVGLRDTGADCEECNGTGINAKLFESKIEDDLTLGDLYWLSIDEVLAHKVANVELKSLLTSISNLGIGHLSLSRSVWTLSTGEFQALYLVSCLRGLDKGRDYFLFLDEPSKGLSQNITNQLMRLLVALQRDYRMTIVYIEHDEYMIRNADYVIDFGSDRKDSVNALRCVEVDKWKPPVLTRGKAQPAKVSSRPVSGRGVRYESDPRKSRLLFRDGDAQYRSTMREFSGTANWIFGHYKSALHSPSIALNLSSAIYSKGTFLYEIAGLITQIVNDATEDGRLRGLFDFYNLDNKCLSCKGSGVTNVIDFSTCVEKRNAIWNKGYLNAMVTSALRNYNFSRVKSMFAHYKKITGFDLGKAVASMSKEELEVLLYGDWKYQLVGKPGKTYVWRGLNFLIQKYIKTDKSAQKALIQKTLHPEICHVCRGRTLRHNEKLLVDGEDIGELLGWTLERVAKRFPKISTLDGLIKICGKGAFLNIDVSTLSPDLQARLKLFELQACRFAGFSIYVKGIPSSCAGDCEGLLKKIAESNEVIVCEAKSASFDQKLLPRNAKLPICESLPGFRGVEAEIKKMKKSQKCPACAGSGRSRVITENERIDNLFEPCSLCEGTGVNPESFGQNIRGVPLKTWFLGVASDVNAIFPPVPLMRTWEDLTDQEISTLLNSISQTK